MALIGRLAQLVRAIPLQGIGRRFESVTAHLFWLAIHSGYTFSFRNSAHSLHILKMQGHNYSRIVFIVPYLPRIQ